MPVFVLPPAWSDFFPVVLTMVVNSITFPYTVNVGFEYGRSCCLRSLSATYAAPIFSYSADAAQPPAKAIRPNLFDHNPIITVTQLCGSNIFESPTVKGFASQPRGRIL
jgi:hypothetical protein